jgi:hypothetical protein
VTGTPGKAPKFWEQEGQRLSPLLDDVYATVVAGTDSEIAASIAIGIARGQGVRRRVAMADLVGESRPLEALISSDDPHGVSDSFLYGVSLNKIARPINDSGTIFLMPSGTEQVANEHVYANERWRRLAAGFHQVGALLLVVAVPGTPGFAELCGYIGALMPVGSTTFPMPPGVRLIAPPPEPTPDPPALPQPTRSTTARARAIAAENQASRRRRLAVIVLGVLAVAVLIGALFPGVRSMLPAPLAAIFTPKAPAPEPDSTSLAVSTAQPVDTLSDSAQAFASDSAAALADSLRVPLEVANPADSVRAARYSIFFTSANNRIAATPDVYIAGLPGFAMSLVPEDGMLWYRVTVGANASRRAVTAMLADLRARRAVGSGGNIIVVPYAFRLADSVPAAVARERVAEYGSRGIVAYAMQQPNGQAVILTGAFETPKQANVLADSLQKIGITPVLVYRTGRAY